MKGIGLIMAAFHQRFTKDKFMDGRESSDLYQKIQIYDVFQLVIGLIGTALCWKSVSFLLIIKYNLEYYETDLEMSKLFLNFNLVLTFLACLLEFFKVSNQLQLRQLSGNIGIKENVFSSGCWKKYIKTCAIFFIHPYPFLVGNKYFVFNRKIQKEIYYHYNDALSVLSLIKVVFLFKFTLDLTKWKSNRSSRIW